MLQDLPIKKSNEDALERASLAKIIWKQIEKIDAENGFCVGIYGEWGSGKTSFINMILEEANSVKVKNNPIIVKFSPWLYTNSTNLIIEFLSEISYVLMSDKKKKVKEVGRKILKYAKIYNESGLRIPVVNQIASSILTCDKLMKKNIYEMKGEICEFIKNMDKKIIVVIDDIDRLNNNEIIQLFQLIKSVANFPNIVYILALDNKLVSNILNDFQKDSGYKYLEKIIQLPVELPKIKENNFKNIFEFKMKELFEGKIDFESYDWKRSLDFILKEIKNIRDIIRLYNKIEIKKQIVDEVYILDLIIINVIEDKDLDLYSFILENKALLVGKEFDYIYSEQGDINSIIKEYMESKNYKSIESKMELIKYLFPYITKNVDNNLERDKRIGSLNFFDRYFTLGIEKNEISEIIVDNILHKIEDKELDNIIYMIIRDDKIDYLLKRIVDKEEERNKERIKIIIKAILNNSEELLNNKVLYSYENIFEWIYYRLINIGLLPNNKIEYKTLEDIFKNGNIQNFSFFSYFLNNKLTKFIISDQDKIRLEKMYLEQLNDTKNDNNLLDLKRNLSCLQLYEKLDKASCIHYLEELFENNEKNKAKYIAINIDDYGNFNSNLNILSKEEIDEVIQKYIEDEELDVKIKEQLEKYKIVNIINKK